jgi:uncharacterized protein DUF1399
LVFHSRAGQKRFEDSTNLDSDLFHEFESWESAFQGRCSSTLLPLSTFQLEGDKVDLTTHKALYKTPSRHPARKYAELFGSVDEELAVLLRDAVMRQTEFVDKMNGHLWIRSPGLEGTLRRGIARYDKFLQLLRACPNTMLVPTLDIDLVWHTHQCTGDTYSKDMEHLVGRFINHDDTIAKGRLGDGFALSRKLFRVHFGAEYQVCGCWDCEALVDELEGFVKRRETDIHMPRVAKIVAKKVSFFRAVEVARREKRALPVWDADGAK